MASGGGISGLAVAMAAAGGILVYSGIQDVPLIDALRDVAAGKPPTPRPPKRTEVNWNAGGGQLGGNVGGGESAGLGAAPSSGIGSAAGNAIVAGARARLGKPYVWAATGPNAYDCSGLVCAILWELGKLPRTKRLTTWGFEAWSGAVNIPGGQQQAGDLVLWNGHMGVYIGGNRMIDAARSGSSVAERNVFKSSSGPRYRRVK